MRRPNGPVIRPRAPSPFWQTCLAIAVMYLGYYVLSFIVGGLINLVGSIL